MRFMPDMHPAYPQAAGKGKNPGTGTGTTGVFCQSGQEFGLSADSFDASQRLRVSHKFGTFGACLIVYGAAS